MTADAFTILWPVAAVVAATLVATVLVCCAVSLARSAAELRTLAEELRGHANAVLEEAEVAMRRARDELDRVEGLVGSAEALSQTVGSAGRLAHAAFSAPLIKLAAFAAGVAQAGRRLRGRAPTSSAGAVTNRPAVALSPSRRPRRKPGKQGSSRLRKAG